MSRSLVSSSPPPRTPGALASTLLTLTVGAVGGLAVVGALAVAAVAKGHLTLRQDDGNGRVRIDRLRVDRLKVEHLHLDPPRPVTDRLLDAAEKLIANGDQ